MEGTIYSEAQYILIIPNHGNGFIYYFFFFLLWVEKYAFHQRSNVWKKYCDKIYAIGAIGFNVNHCCHFLNFLWFLFFFQSKTEKKNNIHVFIFGSLCNFLHRKKKQENTRQSHCLLFYFIYHHFCCFAKQFCVFFFCLSIFALTCIKVHLRDVNMKRMESGNSHSIRTHWFFFTCFYFVVGWWEKWSVLQKRKGINMDFLNNCFQNHFTYSSLPDRQIFLLLLLLLYQFSLYTLT